MIVDVLKESRKWRQFIGWAIQKTVDGILRGQSDGFLTFKHSKLIFGFKDLVEDHLE